jgi:DNA-binding transcriptional MocR family regulator
VSGRRASTLVRWRGLIIESELPSPAKLVALVLSTHMDSNGGSCFPSLTTLAQESGLGRSTVCRALDQVARAGLVKRVRGGRGKPPRYRATSPTAGLVVVPERDSSSPTAGPEDVQEDVHNPSRARTRARERSARAESARSETKTDEFSYLSEAGH